MVKPSQPKGIKPKAELNEAVEVESGGSSIQGNKLIIINTVITVAICALFIGGNYFTVSMIVDSKLKNLPTQAENAEEEEGEEEGEAPEKGIILDLGEFILNLSDPSSKRYLKVNVALEISRTESDPSLEPTENKDGHGGGGSHGAPKAEDPLKVIEAEMSQYKPAIRDAIISVLSSKTAEELSSLAGKELAKEQIKEAVNPIFAGEREVIRVSFGAFIIQ
ncbi:MAG TPA: flagellar basal body-associated FliL family protein [Candidatus Gastranaerophilales bacterium]|nr:flagellar basal body-associated FliL family protein [Candidatus Gastranaerophilales bacterium]